MRPGTAAGDGGSGRSEVPLPAPGDLLTESATHPLLAALLPGIRARAAAPAGSVVAYYEDSPRDGVP
ncbi:hypothetical protein [Streptomyces sp. HNM0574]|uniref:hypothetical protein n=1 Tax=Streptomyces sp. HNM0574 TaxID=2714954 RepID=UPI001F111072|nr:hypothetical protein [Streptomyces sp. HNM0574]